MRNRMTTQLLCILALVMGQSAVALPHLCQSAPMQEQNVQKPLIQGHHEANHSMDRSKMNHGNMDHGNMNHADHNMAVETSTCCDDCQCDINSCQNPFALMANQSNMTFSQLASLMLSQTLWLPTPSLDTPFKPPSIS